MDCIPFASGNEHKKIRTELLAGLDDAEHGRWISLLVGRASNDSMAPVDQYLSQGGLEGALARASQPAFD